MRTDYIASEFGGLVGKTVASVRAMSPEECAHFLWEHDTNIPFLIEFTDGTIVVPSCDPEGNGSGHLFIL